MTEHCYSENSLRIHRHIIAVPIAMVCGVMLGLFTQIEPFHSNQMLYVIGLFTALGLTCIYFGFDANRQARILRINGETLHFHAGGAASLLWQDVLQISCENTELPGKPGSFEPRVVIQAQDSRVVGTETRRFVLDHTYGMPALDLCAELRKQQGLWMKSVAGVSAMARPGWLERGAPDISRPRFGRRATDPT